jgi:hypothetical protein
VVKVSATLENVGTVFGTRVSVLCEQAP